MGKGRSFQGKRTHSEEANGRGSKVANFYERSARELFLAREPVRGYQRDGIQGGNDTLRQ